jgi:gliding motility-associated-like protein
MASLTASCDASQLTVKLNKKVLCSSLTATGSEFKLGSGAANVIGTSGFGCSLGFDTDSVLFKLDKSLPSGNYQLISQTGTDGNTLLDICGTPEAVGDQLAFTVTPPMPTPMDSIAPLGCAPNIIRLVFKKNIRCSSIAADGSDFMISGTNPVTIVGAQGTCDNGLSSTIDIQLSAPINLQGSYQVTLKTGSDGNTILDECAQETPAGSTLDFSTVDTVSANFNYQIHYGCGIDTVMLSNNGGPSINLWQWYFDTAGTSNLQNPQQTYTVFGDQLIVLVVSNGVCSDSAFEYVTLDNTLKADIEAPEMLCPADKANFINNSIGRNLQYSWDFGDGSTDFALTPLAHTYPNNPLADKVYTVSLVVTDDLGCKDTIYKPVRKLHSCYIAVPSAFTPNGDGVNDYLYPLNAFKASDLLFRVYNRYGQMVFETRDWSRKWDGNINGKPQGTGTYVWTLQYTDNDTQKKVVQKGTSVLIR